MMAREIRESRENGSLLLRLLATFAYFAGLLSAVADEPFFKKGDVIALVGGEDLVAMSEYGYLELLLTRALPDHRLKFRNLAWEGDTVFEQRRDLNFPPLEAQLDQVGATVVLCQFGQMESLAGKEKLPEFVAAYEKLIARMSGGRKRRIVLLHPTLSPDRAKEIQQYAWAIADMRAVLDVRWVNQYELSGIFTRDGVHMTEKLHLELASVIWDNLKAGNEETDEIKRELAWYILPSFSEDYHEAPRPSTEGSPQLRRLVVVKNRLWFDYWRVQNWAFLAGDRTEQPSSRDHVDRTKRWFPAEREQFLPLIDAKEQEIWTLAAKLSEQK